MTFILTGIAVSRGIAIGKAHLISKTAFEVKHYKVAVNAIDQEIARLHNAIKAVDLEFCALRASLPKNAPKEIEALLDVHIMILHDSKLNEAPELLIRNRFYNAQWALAIQLEALIAQFDKISNPYLSSRKTDVEQVVERIFKMLAATNGLNHDVNNSKLESNSKDQQKLIIVSHDISPADMLQFKHETFAGFIADLGGKNSHTAIIARSLGIPAALGLVQATELIMQDDCLILDGDTGIVIVDPSSIMLDEYHSKQYAQQQARSNLTLSSIKFAKAQTVDKFDVELLANIEMPEDAASALLVGATGIGLFRSEFLFMNRFSVFPDEEEQFMAYRSAVEIMRGLPVTIRTIDIGADKFLAAHKDCANPALGLRAIRWALSEPHMFLVQLRALLRASAYGSIKILLPMVAHVAEIIQTRSLLQQAKKDLDSRKESYDSDIQIGAMIEIPAAAIALNMFRKHVDFLSIGTNDLIQYTLAIDRTDSAVAHLYDPYHPAILQLISSTIAQGRKFGLPVSICGEMAGDATMTKLLLGMGLRQFSMHPSQILEVKQEILSANQADLQNKFSALMAVFEPEEFQKALGQFGLNGL